MSIIPSKHGNKTNDWSRSSEAIDNANFIEVPEQFQVFSWSPQPPGTENAKVTQVHLHLTTSLGTILIRFKGPKTIAALIEALQQHRENVWGTEK